MNTAGVPTLRPRSVVALAIAGLAIAALAACSPAESPRQRTRIVLVTLDTLRYDSFTGTPDRAPSMPRTAEFAARGQIFQHAYAASPNTQPTHASLLTGLHPWEHGVTQNGVVLDDGFETLPELLGRSGFETAAVVASFPLHARFGFDQGFDVYHDAFTRGAEIGSWEGIRLEEEGFYALGDEVTERAIALLDGSEAERQFLWLHYFDPHDPYGDRGGRVVRLPDILRAIARRPAVVPRALALAREAYERDNAALDRSLERLWARLALDEAEFETHVVVATDHGESFGEGGAIGHGHRVSPELVHVPFFIVSPDFPARARADATGSVDVFDTIRGLADIEDSAGHGRDLATGGEGEGLAVGFSRDVEAPYDEPLTDGTRERFERTRFYLARGDAFHSGDAGTPAPEGTDPALAKRLRQQFERFQRELDGSDAEVLVDPETRRALEALGYAD